jgi:hypothetical protein
VKGTALFARRGRSLRWDDGYQHSTTFTASPPSDVLPISGPLAMHWAMFERDCWKREMRAVGLPEDCAAYERQWRWPARLRTLRAAFLAAKPLRHLVVDDFFLPQTLRQAYDKVPWR